MKEQTAKLLEDVPAALDEVLSYTVDAADDDEKIHEQVDVVTRRLDSLDA